MNRTQMDDWRSLTRNLEILLSIHAFSASALHYVVLLNFNIESVKFLFILNSPALLFQLWPRHYAFVIICEIRIKHRAPETLAKEVILPQLQVRKRRSEIFSGSYFRKVPGSSTALRFVCLSAKDQGYLGFLVVAVP